MNIFIKSLCQILNLLTIKKLFKNAQKLSQTDPQNKYVIITDDESITLGYNYHVIPIQEGRNSIIKKINHEITSS